MKLGRILSPIAAVAILSSLIGCSRPADREDGGSGRRGVIQNKGSDTLVNVAQSWAESYQEVDPNVAVAVTGGGSGTGIAALINGTVDIANASRAMKDSELEQARANGQEPVQFIVGFDALAVYLHADNPIDRMSLEQLAEIYGEDGATESWGQLDAEVPGCQGQEIIRVSRQNNSGTYVYFREAVLGARRDYKLGSRDMHGSKDVVDLVEQTPCAIGYSGLAYATDHVKLMCISASDGGDCVNPSTESAIDGSYPIARPLFMYTRGEPDRSRQGLSRLDSQRRRASASSPRKAMRRSETSTADVGPDPSPPGSGREADFVAGSSQDSTARSERFRPSHDPETTISSGVRPDMSEAHYEKRLEDGSRAHSNRGGGSRRAQVETALKNSLTRRCCNFDKGLASKTILGDLPINRAIQRESIGSVPRLRRAAPAERRATCVSSRP